MRETQCLTVKLSVRNLVHYKFFICFLQCYEAHLARPDTYCMLLQCTAQIYRIFVKNFNIQFKERGYTYALRNATLRFVIYPVLKEMKVIRLLRLGRIIFNVAQILTLLQITSLPLIFLLKAFSAYMSECLYLSSRTVRSKCDAFQVDQPELSIRRGHLLGNARNLEAYRNVIKSAMALTKPEENLEGLAGEVMNLVHRISRVRRY